MKHFKTVSFPASTRKVHDITTCDFCGAVCEDDDHHNSEFDYVVIRRKSGYNYRGEDGHSSIHEVNMCPNCFDSKLVPWVIEQGVDFSKEEYDW